MYRLKLTFTALDTGNYLSAPCGTVVGASLSESHVNSTNMRKINMYVSYVHCQSIVGSTYVWTSGPTLQGYMDPLILPFIEPLMDE